MLFAGVRPRVPEVRQLLTEQLDIPSLHVIGEKDKIKRVGGLRPYIRMSCPSTSTAE